MFKDKLLENKTIVITGGGSGLGKSMARRFGELGANIVISGRRKEVLEETAHDFSEKNINVLTCPGDVRKVEDVEVMSKQTLDKFGTVDALLNNAAGNFISPTEMLSQNDLLAAFMSEAEANRQAKLTLKTHEEQWQERLASMKSELLAAQSQHHERDALVHHERVVRPTF